MMTRPVSKTQSAALALAIGIAGAVLFGAPQAQATVAITSGLNVPLSGEQLVVFGTSQSGTTITGSTSSNTGVQFTSNQTLQTGGIGSSILQAASPETAITGNITATSPSNTFTDFVFNALVNNGTTGGAATVLAVANDGTFSQNVTLSAANGGANFFTIVASAGETINSVSLNLANGTNYSTFLHVGISGVTPTSTVPEPASLALLGTALAGFGLLRRRRKA